MNGNRAEALPAKMAPHSLEAEQNTLGGLLLDNSAWFDVAEIVAAADFFTHDHKIIFAGIGELIASGQPCDFLILTEHFRSRNLLSEVGGMAYLGMLAADTPSAANVLTYAQIVREKAALRQLIAAGMTTADMGYRPDGRGIAEMVREAEMKLAAIRTEAERAIGGARSIASVVPNVESMIQHALEHGQAPGFKTGFIDLDRVLNPLAPGDLTVIAGRPSMGKSAFAWNVAENIAVNSGLSVAYFSLEMSAEQLTLRAFAKHAKVDLGDLLNGRMPIGDWFSYAGGKVRDLPIVIDPTPALSSVDLRARSKRINATSPLALIVVDHILLMTGKAENRTQEVAAISRAMKALAKELNVHVIALCQLNRGVEARDNKRPRMSDLRDAGAIEEDADNVIFLYRDEYYYKDKSPHQGVAEVLIEKQRQGELGRSVDLVFEGKYSKFSNYAGPTRSEREGSSRAEPAKPKTRGMPSAGYGAREQ